MAKTHIDTYRPGPYIFIEEAKVLTDDKGRVFIKARYREYNSITIKGMTRPINRSRTFQVNFENRCLIYQKEVFPAKNLGEVFKFLENLGLNNGVRCNITNL